MASHNAAVWESSHQFYFDSKDPVTPLSLADNLIGLDAIIRKSGDIVAMMIGMRAEEVSVVMSSVELNSYKDSFIYRLVFGKGRAAEKKLDELRKKLHLDRMETKHIVGFALTAALLYGVWKFATPAQKADPSIQIHIENSFNNLGKEVGLSHDEVIELVEAALKGKEEELKKNVVRLTRPQGQESGGSITIDGRDSFVIPDTLIDIVPVEYEKTQPAERKREFTKKEVALRAVDMDRPNTGWWALAPDISDTRLPVVLGDEVDPAKTPVGKYITADFTVIDLKSGKGEYKPKRIILHRVHRN